MADKVEVINEITFVDELQGLINKYSLENDSDTPDFILARYMQDCLDAFNRASQARAAWFGKPSKSVDLGPTSIQG